MTRVLAVLLLVLLVLLVFRLMYAGWSRRARQHGSALVAIDAGSRPRPAGADLTASVSAPGTYLSTTSAGSRLDRVTAGGLGVRARATMTVGPDAVSWHRDGADTVTVGVDRVRGVGLERGMAGKVVGTARIVVVSWHTDEEDFVTGFLPRHAADLPRLVAAVRDLIDRVPTPRPDGAP